MRVRSGGEKPEEWVEWWQIDCIKGVTPHTNCVLTRLVLRDRDRIGAVLPHIWSDDTHSETLQIEDVDWQGGSLSIGTTSPLERIRVRLNWEWVGNAMHLHSIRGAGSRERVEEAGIKIDSLEFAPVVESQVLTVPIAIRGLQRPAFD